MSNPTEMSESQSNADDPFIGVEYVGFWARTLAVIVDTIWVVVVVVAVLVGVYGVEYIADEALQNTLLSTLVNLLLPIFLIVVFWFIRSATPGKMLVDAVIVDAKTGQKPTRGQFIIRYIGYYVAGIPLLLGFLWAGWDKRKQGWHDKMAGTVVIRQKGRHLR